MAEDIALERSLCRSGGFEAAAEGKVTVPVIDLSLEDDSVSEGMWTAATRSMRRLVGARAFDRFYSFQRARRSPE